MLFNIKSVFLFTLQILSVTFLIPRRTGRDTIVCLPQTAICAAEAKHGREHFPE
jgi:hypothetical protein